MTRPRKPTAEQRAAAARLLALSRSPEFQAKLAEAEANEAGGARAGHGDGHRGRERDRRDERR